MENINLYRRATLLFLLSLTGCGGGSTGAKVANTIESENAKDSTDGVSSDWIINPQNYASSREIEGYASAVSVNRGETIKFFVSTSDPKYSIDIYRVGWYGGQGGRKVTATIVQNGFLQTEPSLDPLYNMVECDWKYPVEVYIPTDAQTWVSGVYLAKLTGSSGKQSYIIFVVKDDSRQAHILFQSSVATYQAYNAWGGYSLYDSIATDKRTSYKVSFNRPYKRSQGAGDFLMWEINTIRFLEREGYDVSYSTDVDTHTNASAVLNHKAFLSVGHDEYWSKEMRDGIERARDNGVNLCFLGANTCYWQIRFEADALGTSNRRVVAYKYAYKEDPLYTTNPVLTTCRWRDSPVNRPEASMVGIMYDYNSIDSDIVMADCNNWICNNAMVSTGSVLKGLLGYEVDRLDASSPPNIITLASSPYKWCSDKACSTSENRMANMTYYEVNSRTGVFATGSMQWNWGLDAFGAHPERVNAAAQQITRNVLNHFVET